MMWLFIGIGALIVVVVTVLFLVSFALGDLERRSDDGGGNYDQ